MKLAALVVLMVGALLWEADDGVAAGQTGNSLTMPDSANGEYFSMVLDASGNPVVAYMDALRLTIMHCNDPNCAGGDETINDPLPAGGLNTGFFPSIALDASGNPVVAYAENLQGTPLGQLRILHCDDPNCDGTGEIVSPGFISGDTQNGFWASLVLDASGNPVVSFYSGKTDDLYLVHCGDANCLTGNSVTSPDSVGAVGQYTSLALDASGNPVVSYYDYTNVALKVLHCDDPNCDGVGDNIETVNQTGSANRYTSLSLDSAGNPVISHGRNGLWVSHCGDPNCSVGNVTTFVDSFGFAHLEGSSLKLDSSGRPVVAFILSETEDVEITELRLAACGDASCSSDNTITRLIIGGDSQFRPLSERSLQLDATGNPVLSFYPGPSILHCVVPDCNPDTDGDGCGDSTEKGPDETLGGLRDFQNPYDFYDVLGPGAALPTDGVIDLPNDILGVIQHHPAGTFGYDAQFDRGTWTGVNSWNDTQGPDGVIDLPNDILGVIMQFNHRCV